MGIYVLCDHCEGNGKVKEKKFGVEIMRDCPHCNRRGKMEESMFEQKNKKSF